MSQGCEERPGLEARDTGPRAFAGVGRASWIICSFDCRRGITDTIMSRARPLWIQLALAVTGLLAGGWMVFDGIHVLLRGKYFGPDKPGPWSHLFTALGI